MTLKPSGHGHRLRGLARARGPAWAKTSGGARWRGSGRSGRSSWSRKSSKLMWPQPPVSLVDQADEDLLAEVRRQVDGDRLHVLGRRRPRPAKMTSPVSSRTSSTRVVGVRPAADQEAGEGLRHPERDARSASPAAASPLRLVRADPELARVPALHVRPARARRCPPRSAGPAKASPSAVQSLSVPVSKSRFSGLPSFPVGSVPRPALGETRPGRHRAGEATQRHREAKETCHGCGPGRWSGGRGRAGIGARASSAASIDSGSCPIRDRFGSPRRVRCLAEVRRGTRRD